MKTIEFLMITLATASLVAACQPHPMRPLTVRPVKTDSTAAKHDPDAGANTPTNEADGTGDTTPDTVDPTVDQNPPSEDQTGVDPVDDGGGFSVISQPCLPGDYTQVERLGRPAVNEGLLLSNSLLNTWNTVAPSVDITSAATPIASEARTVLSAIGNDDATIDKIFGSFLPDVMRIDTTIPSGYADRADGTAGATAGLDNVVLVDGVARPIGGRMIKDDVMDVTLSVLVSTSIPEATRAKLITDYVDYDDAHRDPVASFPFLVPPH